MANNQPIVEQMDDLAILLLNDCEPDERLDAITRDAAMLFKVPIAMINLVTSDEIIFKSCIGKVQGDYLDKGGMFCSYAAYRTKPLVVEDATADSFFRDTPLVTGPDAIRSYAGISLRSADGTPLGTLCLFDTVPRQYSSEQLEVLTDLAEMAERQLHLIVRWAKR